MKYVVIGGTGTLGTCLVEKLLPTLRIGADDSITVFSRDELKQAEMKRKFPCVKYVIGDIRDASSLPDVLRDADVVFLVAALKHVDVLEANATEAIKTNVLGVINVAANCAAAGVRHLVFSSTDKAVLPINIYGMTKGIAERYLVGLNGSSDTKFSVFRWGNVVGSRGSVIQQWANSLRRDGTVKITHPEMTRFWIHIEDAVDFMLERYPTLPADQVHVPDMKAARIIDVASAVGRVLGISDVKFEICGIRPGEKIHECLVSSHDFCVRSDTAPRYSGDELEAMVIRIIGGQK